MDKFLLFIIYIYYLNQLNCHFIKDTTTRNGYIKLIRIFS